MSCELCILGAAWYNRRQLKERNLKYGAWVHKDTADFLTTNGLLDTNFTLANTNFTFEESHVLLRKRRFASVCSDSEEDQCWEPLFWELGAVITVVSFLFLRDLYTSSNFSRHIFVSWIRTGESITRKYLLTMIAFILLVALQLAVAFAFGFACNETYWQIVSDPKMDSNDFFFHALVDTVALGFVLELDSLPAELLDSWLQKWVHVKGSTEDADTKALEVPEYPYIFPTSYSPDYVYPTPEIYTVLT